MGVVPALTVPASKGRVQPNIGDMAILRANSRHIYHHDCRYAADYRTPSPGERSSHRQSRAPAPVYASLWSSDADHARTLLQMGLRGAYAGSFAGALQLSLFSTEASLFGGIAQVAPVNTAREFFGVAQIGVVNLNARTIKNHGKYTDRGFNGLAQIGVYNDNQDFAGALQIGAVKKLRGLQVGLVNLSKNGGLPFFPIANVGF